MTCRFFVNLHRKNFPGVADRKLLLTPDLTGKLTLTAQTESVEGIIDDAADGEAVYYGLTGIRVDRPAKGIYIRVKGGRSERVIM